MTRPCILCVDDEPMNLEILESVLDLNEYEVIMSENGRAALEKISEQKIDIVLLDVMMPEVNGFEVCRRIKEDERYRSIPVVMITALTSKEDRIKGLEAGAEDFITKPFDRAEILTRIKMLLKIKDLHDSLNSAYGTIANLTSFGEEMVLSFDPLNFDFISRVDSIVNHILKKAPEAADKPEMVIVGFVDVYGDWQWYRFTAGSERPRRTWFRTEIYHDLNIRTDDGQKIFFYHEHDLMQSVFRPFMERLALQDIHASNMACYVSNVFCVFALNYNKIVSRYDAEVLNSIVMQSLFLKSLSDQVKETEDAFAYTVQALARAAEANDEDTGNHIVRVGEYCALLAKQLGMPEKFVSVIRLQAQMHDVGKIHIPPAILKKPGKLTHEEYEEIKKHTVYGLKILGHHERFSVAKKIAIAHHERWDGSGYPAGLKEEQIPLEARIMNIADQYDALRSVRVYKPAFDHMTTYRTITEGDGRTMPHHFDPQVLKAFKATASQLEEVYERLKG